MVLKCQVCGMFFSDVYKLNDSHNNNTIARKMWSKSPYAQTFAAITLTRLLS